MNFFKKPKHPPYTFLCFRLIKHFIICTAGFCVGLSSEMLPTTSDVLKDRHSLSDFEVEAIQMSQSIGMILGVVAAGLIFRSFAKYTVLIVSMNVLNVSASLFSIPWISQVHVLCLLHAGMGASGGFMVTAGNTGVTLLWREFDATPWLNCLHFFVVMGSLVSRHNAIPYINPNEDTRTEYKLFNEFVNDSQISFERVTTPETVDCDNCSNPQKVTTMYPDMTSLQSSSTELEVYLNDTVLPCNTSGLCDTTQTFVRETITRTVYSDDIVYHYSASGIFVFLFSLTALSLFIYGQPKGFPAGQKTALCAHSSGLRSLSYSVYTTAMLIGFFFFLVSASAGLEGITFGFNDSDYHSDPDWDHISYFMYGIAIARFLSIFLTSVVPLKFYLTIDIIGIVILTSTCCLVDDDMNTAVLTGVTGAFVGLTLPNAMSLASHELHMNSIFVLVLLDSALIGILGSKYLTEHILDQYGDDSLIFVMFAYNLLMVVAFIVMILFINLVKPKSAKFVIPPCNGEVDGKHNSIYFVDMGTMTK